MSGNVRTVLSAAKAASAVARGATSPVLAAPRGFVSPATAAPKVSLSPAQAVAGGAQDVPFGRPRHLARRRTDHPVLTARSPGQATAMPARSGGPKHRGTAVPAPRMAAKSSERPPAAPRTAERLGRIRTTPGARSSVLERPGTEKPRLPVRARAEATPPAAGREPGAVPATAAPKFGGRPFSPVTPSSGPTAPGGGETPGAGRTAGAEATPWQQQSRTAGRYQPFRHQ